jgi:hypothetical protein
MFCGSVMAVIFHHMFCRIFIPIIITVRNENAGCCWFVILVNNHISADKGDGFVQ